jgi:hypothetical protein
VTLYLLLYGGVLSFSVAIDDLCSDEAESVDATIRVGECR